MKVKVYVVVYVLYICYVTEHYMNHKQPMCSVWFMKHGMECTFITRQCAAVGGCRCPEAVSYGRTSHQCGLRGC